MPSYSHRLKLLSLLAALVLTAVPSFCFGSEARKPDAVKREIGRAENFLLRTYDELNKSLEYEKAAIEGLENSPGKDAGVKAFLEWHRSYAAWLRDRIADTESDLENFYSGKAQRVRINRYPAWADDYARLNEQLNGVMQSLDRTADLNAARIRKLSAIVEYREYIIEQTEKRRVEGERRKPDRNPPEDWFIYAGDLSDEKINGMLGEIAVLGDMQKAIGRLRDLERHEADWIRIKYGDSEALSAVADAVMDYSPDGFEEATDNVIRRYESDIAFLEKTRKELDSRQGAFDPGGISALDPDNAYSDYYFIVKTRLEHHVQWLKEQIGGFRADIVLLAKERAR